MKSKIYNSRLSIVKPWSNIYQKRLQDGSVYYDGLYFCEHGVVEATSEIDKNVSYLRFVYKGILHMRTIQKAYSQRGISVMAGKFVKEIINSKK